MSQLASNGESTTDRGRIGTVFHPSVLPPRNWLQQALLYTDQVAVIAPETHGFEDFVMNRYSRVGDHTTVAPEIGYLLDSRSLVPVSAEEIYFENPELPERVIEALEHHPNLEKAPDATIFPGKFMYVINDYLEQRGLLEPPGDGYVVRTKRPVLETTLSLMAGAAAANLNQMTSEYRYGSSTTSAEALKTVAGLNSAAAKQLLAANAIHITLPDLPSPSSRANLRDIIAFRDDVENRVALDRLKAHVTDGLRENLFGAADVFDFELRLNQFRKTLAEEVAELNERLHDAGVAYKRIRRTVIAPTAEIVGAGLLGALSAALARAAGMSADVHADAFTTGIMKFFEITMTKMATLRIANQEDPWAYLDVTDRRARRLFVS